MHASDWCEACQAGPDSVIACRGSREEAAASTSTREAPPAPGLTRRPPKQSEQQEQQVSDHRACIPPLVILSYCTSEQAIDMLTTEFVTDVCAEAAQAGAEIRFLGFVDVGRLTGSAGSML